MDKIIGVTVGTPTSPAKIEHELKPAIEVAAEKAVENMGGGNVDLSNYYTIPETDTAIAKALANAGGGSGSKDLYWQEEILSEGIMLTTDTPAIIHTGITFGDIKKLDVLQFNYSGTVSGDFFLGFLDDALKSQWYIGPLLFRNTLTSNLGYIKITLYNGGAVAEIIAGNTVRAVSMDMDKIAVVTSRGAYQINRVPNMVKLKGAIFENNDERKYPLTDDTELVLYFSNTPTADMSWKLIGGKCDVLL